MCLYVCICIWEVHIHVCVKGARYKGANSEPRGGLFCSSDGRLFQRIRERGRELGKEVFTHAPLQRLCPLNFEVFDLPLSSIYKEKEFAKRKTLGICRDRTGATDWRIAGLAAWAICELTIKCRWEKIARHFGDRIHGLPILALQ